jgi:glycerate kinase
MTTTLTLLLISTMHILIAPNAFKNSLTAVEAAEAIQKGLIQSGLMCTTKCFPVGDGGDGTAELIVRHLKAQKIETESRDPMGRKIQTSIGFIDSSKTAIIEMADSAGLKLLKQTEYNPLNASSYGTGEQIRAALDRGAKKIILGVGGSATVDGGCGILQALGIRFLDYTQNDLDIIPKQLVHLDSIDISGLDKRILETEIIVLCDVDNFLLGENGAVAIFGPQKGASVSDVKHLENALQRLSAVARLIMGKDMNAILHGGAAGGAAAGLQVFLQAQLLQGITYFLELTDFDASLAMSDLLITGEGSIDLQTLNGKGPYGVAKRAKQKNIPVIALGGSVPIDKHSQLDACFDLMLAIGHQPTELKIALQETSANLKYISRQIGCFLKIKLE